MEPGISAVDPPGTGRPGRRDRSSVVAQPSAVQPDDRARVRPRPAAGQEPTTVAGQPLDPRTRHESHPGAAGAAAAGEQPRPGDRRTPQPEAVRGQSTATD